MSKTLHALIVEDSEDDTELLLRELRRGSYEPVFVRVDTPETMRSALESKQWQVVFSDFTMPQFNAFDALAMLRQTGQDIPFIIVSGTIGEDRAVNAMKAGAHDYILKGNLKRLVPAVERELRESRVRQAHREAEEVIHRLAYTDTVTGLPNRICFQVEVEKAIDKARGQHPLALVLMDLRRFKEINDALGHNHGDTVLQQVGMRLQSTLFTPDVVARLGGDEFGILLPHLSSTDDIEDVIVKIQAILAAPFMVEGIPIAVEASIGVAAMPEHADNADALLQHADIAMYRAKELASRYTIYAPQLSRHSPEGLALMSELRDAVKQDQLVLHFQPKVEITSNRVVGSEALVRWQHPRLGLLSPDHFIPAAEHTGLIGPLTHLVLNDALKQCQNVHHEGFALKVSVNLSARSLHDPHLLESVEKALQDSGAEPQQLILEITESAIVLDPKHAEASLTELSRMGIWLSIDDFGTGFTSLGSLQRLPVNEIKIDKSFVREMLSNQSDAMIVRSVIELGHNLGLRVVAEGVESANIFNMLADLGCDEIQGYYIARPQPCETLKQWLTESPWKFSANY